MSLLQRKPAPKNSFRPYNAPGRAREVYGIQRDMQMRSPFRSRGFVVTASLTAIMFIATIVVAVTMTLTSGFWTTATMENCVVTEKSVAVVDGYSEYRVHTENCDVLTVSDSYFDGQYTSATLYGKIKEGGTYTFETRGNRFGLFSQFPNITGLQQVS